MTDDPTDPPADPEPTEQPTDAADPARLDGLTVAGAGARDEPLVESEWWPVFLEALAALPDVTAAARAAQVSRQLAYEQRDRYPHFKVLWNQALETALDRAEGEVYRRGVFGRKRLERRLDGDGKVLESREVSEVDSKLLLRYLEAHRREKWDPRVRVEASGPGGGPIEHQVTRLDPDALDEFDAEVERLYLIHGGGEEPEAEAG